MAGAAIATERLLLASPHADHAQAMHDFVTRIPDHRKALEGFVQQGNQGLYAALDTQLDRLAAGL